MAGISKIIATFNNKRDPEKVQLKYTAMRESSFHFLRGTCHLFYAEIAKRKSLPSSPAAWLCGDLHLENFGSFKGSDREVYFDLNDFDEAILGPSLWDVSRLLTSIAVACNNAGYKNDYSQSLLEEIIKGYSLTLQSGKPITIENGTATGIVKMLFERVATRKEKKLVQERTTAESDYSILLIDNKHLFKTDEDQKKQLIRSTQAWLDETRGKGKRKILDLAFMVAGTGSIGVKRYLLLVQDTERNKKYLLVIKQALPSSLLPYLETKQPAWQNDAERISSVQHRMQHISPGGFGIFSINDDWYVAKWTQPVADKINLDYFIKEKKEHLSLMNTLGQLTASAQLRSGGRNGSAIADEMIAFGTATDWQAPLMEAAIAMAGQTEEDFKEYCHDYDAGYLKFVKNKYSL